MKIRQGFVSNSSSSSFVITKAELTEEQIQTLRSFFGIKPGETTATVRVPEALEDMGKEEVFSDTWDITETDEEFTGDTYMDNDFLHPILNQILKIKNPIVWEND